MCQAEPSGRLQFDRYIACQLESLFYAFCTAVGAAVNILSVIGTPKEILIKWVKWVNRKTDFEWILIVRMSDSV